LEPTWGEPFADATHIKLAEGEPTTDRPAAARLDALKVFVLQTSTAGAPAAAGENAP
jgi:hypothetical protein